MAVEQRLAKWKISSSEESKVSISSTEQKDQRHLAVPFRGHITGGMRPGRKVIIFAVLDAHPDRFYIALTCGCGMSREPPLDVALEICVRFKERQVLRRACVRGAWGRADSAVPFFPFIKDQPFKMEMQCEHGRFRVFLDGQQLFDFHHRVAPLHLIDTLWIRGSVAITKLA
ncbi:galectin-related protein-like isoform X2 [Dunckerocampus dactyliophorus]|uniref:galectin-related protein-like isoform X2 n=1 Tax=Dunckerocampus dactyliophorus TaxID=161453 RepID=UPI002404B26D|nr:galectin-related protein-like isoform X2 [Dunckerocampus dactyliophorus]